MPNRLATLSYLTGRDASRETCFETFSPFESSVWP